MMDDDKRRAAKETKALLDRARLGVREDPGAAYAVEMMKSQLLIVLTHRLGGDVIVSVDELDTLPVGRVLTIAFDEKHRHYRFRTPKVEDVPPSVPKRR